MKSHKKTRKSRSKGGSWWNPFSTNVAAVPVEPKRWSIFSAAPPAQQPPVVEEQPFNGTPVKPFNGAPFNEKRAGKKSKK